ncbi:MAG: hypothetical protein ACLGXA_09565 [Acidobacteriota bacterium]
MRAAFQAFGAVNKYERAAAALTGIFPELLWKLPPNREKWQSDARAMLVACQQVAVKSKSGPTKMMG